MLEDQEDSPGRSAIDRLCTKTLLERGKKKGEILCVHPCGKWKVMPGSSELRKTSCVVKQAFLFRAGMPAKPGEAWLGRAGSRRGGSALGPHHTPFLARGVGLPVPLFRWLLPTTCLPKAGKLFLPWPTLQTLGLAFKWLIPVHLPGRSSKHPHEPKGRAVQR